MRIAVVENVLKVNDEIAALNREHFKRTNVFVVDVMGAPGCGKTALIESTIRRIGRQTRIGVIVGDLTTQRDAERMARFTRDVVQVNTGKTCHLEAHHVRRALENLDLERLDLLFIENVGNLICPVGFDLGQNAKVAVFSVTGGDDKAAKHPYIVTTADLLVLNKIDLLPHVSFDLAQFHGDVRRQNVDAPLLDVSAHTGQGMEAWVSWLSRNLALEQLRHVGRISI
jgi:hydrogenase nickel incorporation protein HypB